MSNFNDFIDPEEEMLKQLAQLQQTMMGMQQVLGQLAQAVQYMARPKEVVRGQDGRVVGVR